jgi:hypothetical protein
LNAGLDSTRIQAAGCKIPLDALAGFPETAARKQDQFDIEVNFSNQTQ